MDTVPTIDTRPPSRRIDPDALVDLADALAHVSHTGQKRKGTGAPYTVHLQRVAARVEQYGPRAETIAWLHDILEDTKMTAFTLSAVHFPQDIVDDVLALSRRPKETYWTYIYRLLEEGSMDALRVKAADVEDNLSDGWDSKEYESLKKNRYEPTHKLVVTEIARRRLIEDGIFRVDPIGPLAAEDAALGA